MPDIPLTHPPMQLVRDHVAETLDDLAALGEHWTRNRSRGRMPNGIRTAMVMTARELVAMVDLAAAGHGADGDFQP